MVVPRMVLPTIVVTPIRSKKRTVIKPASRSKKGMREGYERMSSVYGLTSEGIKGSGLPCGEGLELAASQVERMQRLSAQVGISEANRTPDWVGIKEKFLAVG